MKKYLLVCIISVITITASAQIRSTDIGAQGRDQIYVGSGLNLGFFNGLILGLNPELGYSLNRFVDVGVATNLTYITRNYGNGTDRQLITGGGPYLRVWPVHSLFAGGQFEYNYISFSSVSNNVVTNRIRFGAPSLLAGIGYGTRMVGNSQFYTSIMVDVLNDPQSPYIDAMGRKEPVFRTAFLFYLRPKK
ncbi:MAG: hypothetical protein ACO3BD_02965 [Chitinophagaceae bacterium]